MNKPSWFVASLLGAFALLLSAHLGMIGYAAQRCALYGARLGNRMDQAQIGGPAAQRLHQEIVENGTKCGRLIDDFQKASDNYQSTILALLGGAGLSAGVGATSQKRSDEFPPPTNSQRKDEY
jgi:hypothetical protein